MPCHEFEQRIQFLLDHRLDPQRDAALAKHAQTCESCGERLVAQRLLFVALKLPLPCHSNLLANRVLRTETPLKLHERFSSRIGWGTALVALACAWWSLTKQPSPRSTEAGTVATIVELSPSAPTLPVAHVTSDDSAVSRAVPKFTASEPQLSQETLVSYRVVFESLATQIHANTPLEEVHATLSPGLNPIRSSFGLTLDALRRTMPRGKEDRPSRPPHGAYLPTETTVLS